MRRLLVLVLTLGILLSSVSAFAQDPATQQPSTEELEKQKAELKKNAKARAVFDAFPPSHKREYIDWVDAAKTAETKQRRLATAIAWISAGKSRNWKYQR